MLSWRDGGGVWSSEPWSHQPSFSSVRVTEDAKFVGQRNRAMGNAGGIRGLSCLMYAWIVTSSERNQLL